MTMTMMKTMLIILADGVTDDENDRDEDDDNDGDL